MRRSIAIVIALLVSACGGGTGPLGTADPRSATTTQGRFALAFTIERSTVRPTDVVAGSAKLTLLTPGGATITGPSTFVTFEFAEVGGEGRDVVPTAPPDCAPHQVSSSEGLDIPIAKSGTVVDGPNADWYRQFLQDPEIHLPAGDWDVTAIATFFDGRACSGQPYYLRTTLRVHVTG
ncbi:MAG TPA: hypothetical protein VE011_07045 [Candidatus Dormibacteraeota bacterium]|nr:hypothetical protein [Candidatus Dormibacteraeota bacterium]